jgi:hypothetical protein
VENEEDGELYYGDQASVSREATEEAMESQQAAMGPEEAEPEEEEDFGEEDLSEEDGLPFGGSGDAKAIATPKSPRAPRRAKRAKAPRSAAAVKFEESKHLRKHGKFADKPGAGNDAPRKGRPKQADESPGDEVASASETKKSRQRAEAKIAAAPVPSSEAAAKARAELEKASKGEGRHGGDARGGSAASRRKQRENLFAEWGGHEKGYVVCPWSGIKMHWTDDPKLNPNGYPKFERGKIFVKKQGGGYQLPNLIPESFKANRSRNDKPLRRENLD